MKIQGAIIKEQGITFGIIIVKKYVVESLTKSNKTINDFSGFFDNIPLILMTQDAFGTPIYRGRKDIVNFISSLHISQIPWREYTVS